MESVNTGNNLKKDKFNNSNNTHVDVLKVDAVSMLKTTNKEMKTLLHNLNKVVKTGEDFHKELIENIPQEFEVFDGGITVNLKVNLKDRNPPCTLNFSYMEQSKFANSKGFVETKPLGDLFVYVSKTCKDPSE
jgi:hypothetical protein